MEFQIRKSPPEELHTFKSPSFFPTQCTAATRMINIVFLTLLLSILGSLAEIPPGDPEDELPDSPFTPTESTSTPSDSESSTISLAERVQHVLDHFKQENPRGLPGVLIPDPMPIPDFAGDFSGTKLQFSEAQLHGLSQFELKHVRVDAKELSASVALSFETLQVLGRYKMGSWFSRSSGNFNVTLVKVHAEGTAALVIDANGNLQTSDIALDVKFADISLKFDNLGFFGSLFQGIINSVGTFVFDSIKPMIFAQVNDQLQQVMNTQMRSLGQTFANSLPPIDYMIAQLRSRLIEEGLDPFYLPEKDDSAEGFNFNVKLYNGELRGLSTIHRSGNVTASLEDTTLHVHVQVGTQKLEAKYDWVVEVGSFSWLNRKGAMKLKIESLDVTIAMSQSLDTRKKPQLKTLQIVLGNINVSSHGAGTLDYIIEFGVNFGVNGLRHLILKALEPVLKDIIQKQLDELDVEALINQQLASLPENQIEHL